MLSQDQARKRRMVSRPTLTRVYNKALRVIAKALIEGKDLEIEGGNYNMERARYRCKKSFKLIEGIRTTFDAKTVHYSATKSYMLNPNRHSVNVALLQVDLQEYCNSKS
jgi:N12 class adenine-specific DNA methylase